MILAKRIHLFLFRVSLLCFCLMIVAGCGASSEKLAHGYDNAMPVEQGSMEEYDSDYYAESKAEGELNTPSQVVARHVIRTGSLTIAVTDTRKTVEQVEKMTADNGGLVSESNVYEYSEGRYSASLTLRIPEKQFDSFMARLQDLGETDDVRKSSEDVTLPYLDMEARLKNLKTEEERLREILDMAGNMEEILQVERELSRVRGEIELLTMNFTRLQDLVAFSTIELYVNEKAAGIEKISPKPFENMGKRLRDALFGSINFISSATTFILVALTALLPVLIIIALIVLLVLGLVRAVKRKKGHIPPGGKPPAVS